MRITKLILVSITILFFFISCDKDDSFDPNAKGELVLGFTSNENLLNLKNSFKTGPVSLLLSVKNNSGDYEFYNEKIELYKFNNEYISSPISFLVGEYQITDFMVLDESNNVLYATPKEGSSKEYLVSDPLIIDFIVFEDDVTKISPEVISTENITPEDFGYNTFSFNQIETFNFLTAIFIYDDINQNFDLTEADALIISGSDTLFNNNLEAVTNLITVNANYDAYTIKITKSGYEDYSETFSKDSLEKHFSKPLTIILSEGNILVLRPNAEDGKDATIGNYYDYVDRNFGTYEEFTANAWTTGGNETTLRSLIEFDLSLLPDDAIIVDAQLYLYVSENTTHGPGHSQLSGSNECILQRITSSWDENTVTWNTQPSTTEENQVVLPASEYDMQDYVVDVSNLIIDIIDNPTSGFGFMLRLNEESYYRRMLFASSDHSNDSLHPKLVITYE